MAPKAKEKAAPKAKAEEAPKSKTKTKEPANESKAPTVKISEDQNIHPKQVLQILLQKKLRKPLTKADMEYTTEEAGGIFTTTLSLPCDGGQSFVGAFAKNKKTAEANASQKAIAAYSKEVGKVAGKRSLSEGEEPSAKKAKTGIDTGPSMFCQLNSLIPQITRTAIAKGDISAEMVEVSTSSGTGYQCTLTIACLPGHESTQFTGQPGSSQKEAKNNAASEAIVVINNDANLKQMMANAIEAKKEKNKTKPAFAKWQEKLEKLKAERKSKN
eukprot:gnl/MRDRNA2_/MRDRNA2_99743_c0_seq1.p1 gnl/MRDRNA2_/MRDRNA2_99743_c0~~gnl/MRDRNA2_/MRDRNA2_99743_c0_seq1.p1  ORF type:complete len:280 (+),score=94.52 gnl/MRDRNA2_/MRDRNA2_99743_c0_seq1:25-840(+)